jgi:hypothetical protein
VLLNVINGITILPKVIQGIMRLLVKKGVWCCLKVIKVIMHGVA